MIHDIQPAILDYFREKYQKEYREIITGFVGNPEQSWITIDYADLARKEQADALLEKRMTDTKFPSLQGLNLNGARLLCETFWTHQEPEDRFIYEIVFDKPVKLTDAFYGNVRAMFQQDRKERCEQGVPDITVNIEIRSRYNPRPRDKDSRPLPCDKMDFTIGEIEQEWER